MVVAKGQELESPWEEFQEAVDALEKELGVLGAKAEVEKHETLQVGYLYQAKLSQEGFHGYLSVDGRSKSKDIFDWHELTYSINIGHADGTVHSVSDRFTRKGDVPDLVFWVMKAFFNFNLKARKVDMNSLFGESEIRVLGFPGMDNDTLLTSLLTGASIEEGIPPEVRRFRHVTTKGSLISVRFSYAIRVAFTWVIFPDITGLSGGSSHSSYVSIERAISKLDPRRVDVKHYDYGYKEFMAYFARRANHLSKSWDLVDKHETSIDFYLRVVALPQLLESKFRGELEKVEDNIWRDEYPEALRAQRALMQDSLQELINRHGIVVKAGEKIGQLAGALVERGVLERRLKSWFDAYPAFANPSAHKVYPTKKDLEDEVVRSRTSITLWLGKHLLYEVFLALRDSDPSLPKPTDLGEVFPAENPNEDEDV